jgi:hypothetical protein
MLCYYQAGFQFRQHKNHVVNKIHGNQGFERGGVAFLSNTENNPNILDPISTHIPLRTSCGSQCI